jgi:ribose transport system ATP-binding protein
MRKEILRFEHISKKINDVKVLKNISFNLYEGEICKIFGGEGQSATTLVRILGGVFLPDFGKVYLDGSEVEITTPDVGKKLGISIINKASDLIPNLTVCENMFLNRRDSGSGIFFRYNQFAQRTRDLLDILGLDISPNTIVSNLKPEQIQLLQLGKALLDDPKVVVMDHTNILLDRKQIQLFERVFQELARRKVGVLIVAQHMKDFTSVSDRVYIMKDGSIIGNLDTPSMVNDKIIQIIAEDSFVDKSRIPINHVSKEILRVENLCTQDDLRDVSFTLKKGEIISITGSFGSGKCMIGHALYGLEPITGGKVFLENKPIKIKKPSDAIKHKIGLVSYEHKDIGLLYNLNIKENITISRLDSISHLKIIKKELEDFLVQSINTDIGLDLDSIVSLEDLSVADQRKVSIAKIMSFNPKVMILIDPTKGLDNESRKQILELLVRFSYRGGAIILISSNIYEILQISNRVFLYSDHTITGMINENDLKYKEQLSVIENLM